jgi:hypothetical protein
VGDLCLEFCSFVAGRKRNKGRWFLHLGLGRVLIESRCVAQAGLELAHPPPAVSPSAGVARVLHTPRPDVLFLKRIKLLKGI